MKIKRPTVALTIKLGKTLRWEHKEEVEAATRELESLGYEALALVHTKLLWFVKMKAFAHNGHKAYAILHAEAQSVWVDLFSVTADGKACFAATNAEAPLIGAVAQRPTFFISHQLPKVTVTVLHQEFRTMRPRKTWAAPALRDLPTGYGVVCAADAKWQAAHLAGEAADGMGKIVEAAYERARAVRRRNPVDDLLFLLRDLRLPKGANPKPPQSLTAAAMDGDLEAVKQFLASGANINEKSVGYACPVAAAALRGQTEMVDYLLNQGADPTRGDFAMFTALATAAREGHCAIVERLLKHGIPKEQKQEALRQARHCKHDDIVQLLEDGPRKANKGGKAKPKPRKQGLGDFLSALDGAVSLMGQEPQKDPISGKGERVEAGQRVVKLLERPEVRAGLGQVHKKHGSFLDLAVETGSLRLTQAVVEAGAPAETVSRALVTAAGLGLRDHVTLLLQAGADPQFNSNGGGSTALIAAARWGDVEIVRCLLDADANPKARTKGGETAMTAASGPFRKQIQELLNQSAKPKTSAGGSAIQTQGNRRKFDPNARGAAEFKASMGHPEWSIGFFESPPEAVAGAFAKLYPDAKWFADTAGKRLTARPPVILIFRLRGQPWTILLRTVGWLEMEDIKGLPADVRELSAALKVRAVSYMSEDTSGCEGYEIFKNGKSIERADWMGDVEFKSSWRKQPKFDESFPEPTFSELGLYLPECWMDNDGFETKLILGGLPAEAIERLDCFALRTA